MTLPQAGAAGLPLNSPDLTIRIPCPCPLPNLPCSRLATVTDPNTGKDFVSTKQLKNLRVGGGDVAFDVELGYPANSQIGALRRALIARRSVPGVENVSANLSTRIVAHAVQRGVQLLPG